MHSLFDSKTQQTILNRIENLNENTESSWGKMNVSQMLKHCQLPLEVALGKRELEEKIGPLKKLVFKLFKPLMYNDKPWKRHLGTAKEFVVTDRREFSSEKALLIQVINEFSVKSDAVNWPHHPFFGKFTNAQWGKMQYKHLDHHLTQFGV